MSLIGVTIILMKKMMSQIIVHVLLHLMMGIIHITDTENLIMVSTTLYYNSVTVCEYMYTCMRLLITIIIMGC